MLLLEHLAGLGDEGRRLVGALRVTTDVGGIKEKSLISCFPLHATQDRGSCMYLFCGFESLQGVGTSAETIRYKYECGQGDQTCKKYSDHTDNIASEQTDYQQDYAHETTSMHRSVIL